MLLLPGLFTLALSIAPVVPAALAQTESVPTEQPQRQKVRQNKLNLTDSQRQALQSQRNALQQRIYNEVLSPEQKAQYDQAIKAGQKPGQIIRTFQFSDSQKQALRQIREDAKAQMQSFLNSLTPEQRNALQQRRQGLKQGRQGWQQRQQGQSQPGEVIPNPGQ